MKRKPAKTRPVIVCGTDFTDNARQAGNVAAALAATLDRGRRRNARCVLRLPTLRRVLVTTDFSTRGDYAIACAVRRGQAGRTLAAGACSAPEGDRGRRVRDTAREHREARQIRPGGGAPPAEIAAARSSGLDITVEAGVVECEDAAKGILQDAERYGADVIVIGSQGLSGIERAVLGSVAQAVMRHTRRPVFVVRSPK